MQIKYSPNSDALIIRLKEGELVDSQDISSNMIVHYSEQKEPLEIEILNASNLVQLDDVDVQWRDIIRQQSAVFDSVPAH